MSRKIFYYCITIKTHGATQTKMQSRGSTFSDWTITIGGGWLPTDTTIQRRRVD